MLIPIGTDVRPRHPPYVNWAIIALNVLVFLVTDYLGGEAGQQLKAIYTLDGARPLLYQYITYQFLHGDVWHLVGNMLFLWIFGNAVCDRMGGPAYVLFYLAGGVFAGFTFAADAHNPIIGASGAIAAVTTAFLALYPRVHVTMLFWFFFIVPFQIPAMLLIVCKIILWDNILSPQIGGGTMSNVAYSAHLGGYAFGFVVAILMLAVRALPRNQFDLLALWSRWRRRSGLATQMTFPGPPRMARPIEVEEVDSRPLQRVPLTPTEQLREEVLAHVSARELDEAAAAYLRLMSIDANIVLPRAAQLDIANHLTQLGRHADAVHAYENLLAAYPTAPDAYQVRLLVGLICSRYLGQYEKAAGQLRHALEGLSQAPQRALAEEELTKAESRITGG